MFAALGGSSDPRPNRPPPPQLDTPEQLAAAMESIVDPEGAQEDDEAAAPGEEVVYSPRPRTMADILRIQ